MYILVAKGNLAEVQGVRTSPCPISQGTELVLSPILVQNRSPELPRVGLFLDIWFPRGCVETTTKLLDIEQKKGYVSTIEKE